MLIQQATLADAEEILVLQRLAYLSEAELYNDFTIPPLTQTLAELLAEFRDQLFLKAMLDGKVIGSVRGFLHNGTCHVGRLMVHPEVQGNGIGTLLMTEIEGAFPEAKRFELFTGHLSKRNIALYERLGYRIFRNKEITPVLTLVFMEKMREAR